LPSELRLSTTLGYFNHLVKIGGAAAERAKFPREFYDRGIFSVNLTYLLCAEATAVRTMKLRFAHHAC
jgi:hypothetical protein